MGYITSKAIILNINVDTTIDNEEIDIIVIDTTTGAVTLTLPAIPEEGLFYYVKDTGNAGTNNIIIEGNGKTVETASTYTLSIDYAYTEVFYCSINDKWFIL